jgi:hypothetical protein
MKATNSHNGWKAKDIKLILLTKPCLQPKRSKRNWRWLHSAKEAAELLGRSVASIKNQRAINHGSRRVTA